MAPPDASDPIEMSQSERQLKGAETWRVAAELSPSMLHTRDGRQRNEKGQIMRPDGSPIARLYSAGGLGSIYRYPYQRTGSIGEYLDFGRISGQTKAAEEAWDVVEFD
jgi:hypothetical protein